MQEPGSPSPRPFWQRLNTFFAFPFQLQPLAYALLLAASSLLIHLFFFLPQPLILLLIELGIVLAASRYGFKVMALGSRGIVRAHHYTPPMLCLGAKLGDGLEKQAICNDFAVFPVTRRPEVIRPTWPAAQRSPDATAAGAWSTSCR